MKKIDKKIILLLVVFSLVGLTASACDVPVFRYALERWQADKFKLEIPETLQVDKVDDNSNLSIEKKSTQQVKVYFPHANSPFLVEEQEDFSYAALIDSPARREIAKRLIAGDSVVWVALTKDGQLPEQEALEQGLRSSEKKLSKEDRQLKFSTLSIKRDSKEERYFIASLLTVENDLMEIDESMVFPVFGRGRVLEPVIAQGINEENINEMSTYLSGDCSCEIKNQNPGLDLLFNFNWEEALEGKSQIVEKSLPELSGVLDFKAENPPSKAPASNEPVPEKFPDSPEHEINGSLALYLGAGLLLVIVISSFIIFIKR
ncbi:hypothetical protein PQO03_04465 [Lentisphaera profundi]|uniref:DUF2330 domain-containing protein n=1 Tax=Lentisphaera profundi TaxID=1658616 RepID=A0ABY7VSM6_9BACT|nr:hypothetical protein [Lentisphaera profundi]WDE97206.1 hypothetical protein PQO03_04465 [Lentisphaera profundi]